MKAKKTLFIAALCLILGYIVIVGYFALNQASLIYEPSRRSAITPQYIGLKYEEVTLETSDGLNISAWYVPAQEKKGTVLFCHGNDGSMSDRLDLIRLFNTLHMDVFIFDYRGYGKSQGYPSEDGTYRDAEAAWDYLVDKMHIQPEKIIIFGHSLGSAIAAEMALRHEAGGLIIDSGFTSIMDVGRKLYPYLPVNKWLVKYKYDTIDKIARIDIPKLIIHSPYDEIVPFEEGVELYEKAAEPKELLVISGGHAENALLSRQRYTDRLAKFMSEHVQ